MRKATLDVSFGWATCAAFAAGGGKNWFSRQFLLVDGFCPSHHEESHRREKRERESVCVCNLKHRIAPKVGDMGRRFNLFPSLGALGYTPDLRGNILSASEITNQRLDGVNGSPRDSPPTSNHRNKSKSQSLRYRTLASFDQVNFRSFEGHHNDGYAVKVFYEPSTSLQLEVDLIRTHVLGSMNAH
jgi:hypothetical protein